jgi:ATP-dependent DNA ligase
MNDFSIPVVDDITVKLSHRWTGIMKCVPFSEDRLAKWEPPYIVQPKYDGNRCINKPFGPTSLLMSSEENQFLSVPHIVQELMDSELYKIPLDGELYSHALHLEGGHELINSIASRKTNLHPRHKELEFWIFDLKNADIQYDRITALCRLPHFPEHIKMTPFWICRTLTEVKHVYDKIIKDGFEGVIIRSIRNKYEEKRSTQLMKFKPNREDTYDVVGWNEEVAIDGTPKGRIGSLVLSSQTGDVFSVGAGLNDKDRAYLWDVRDTLAGHRAVVKYQHLTNKQIPKGCLDIKVIEKKVI